MNQPRYPLPGPKNLITDIEGIHVGNYQDEKVKSGTTAVVLDQPAIAAVHVMGGAPGTRDTELLSPENTVETVDAVCLSGGSAFGLDAAGGVSSWLREQGRGFAIGPHRVPIVPAAIIFDLINGGDKDWGTHSPYREWGYAAAQNAGKDFALGSHGAGSGAIVAGLKGGLGSASLKLPNGITLGAIVAVNALGSPLIGSSRNFWAAPFEIGSEFGGLSMPSPWPQDASDLKIKFRETVQPGSNTTIAVIATDAVLTKAQTKRLAVATHDGFARAIWPCHTPLDGDLIFGLATGGSGIAPEMDDWIDLGAYAASTMARAIARGVFEATPAENDPCPTWSQT